MFSKDLPVHQADGPEVAVGMNVGRLAGSSGASQERRRARELPRRRCRPKYDRLGGRLLTRGVRVTEAEATRSVIHGFKPCFAQCGLNELSGRTWSGISKFRVVHHQGPWARYYVTLSILGRQISARQGPRAHILTTGTSSHRQARGVPVK